jgi:phosphatidylserine decarboxylase
MLSARGDDMRLGPIRRTYLLFLWLLPKNLISKLGGMFASIPWPGPLLRLQLRAYAWTWGANMDEVRDPLTSFRSMQEFFVRRLKEDARPIDPAGDAFVSPCDGAWGASGTVEQGQLLQVKGRPYSLAELLGSEEEAKRYEGGAYATLYLSPKDYHRYHSPCAARIVHSRYVPGALWPVNKVGVYGVDGLFAQNERIVSTFEVGSGKLAYIPVGATVVGKVRLTYSDLTTNVRGGPREERHDPPVELAKGEEVGQFYFGSTVVLVATPGLLELDFQPPDTPCVLGRRIGTVKVD